MVHTTRSTLRGDQRGQSAVEYLVVVGTVALTGVLGFAALGDAIEGVALGGADAVATVGGDRASHDERITLDEDAYRGPQEQPGPPVRFVASVAAFTPMEPAPVPMEAHADERAPTPAEHVEAEPAPEPEARRCEGWDVICHGQNITDDIAVPFTEGAVDSVVGTAQVVVDGTEYVARLAAREDPQAWFDLADFVGAAHEGLNEAAADPGGTAEVIADMAGHALHEAAETCFGAQASIRDCAYGIGSFAPDVATLPTGAGLAATTAKLGTRAVRLGRHLDHAADATRHLDGAARSARRAGAASGLDDAMQHVAAAERHGPPRLVVGGGQADDFPRLGANDVSINIEASARPHVVGDINAPPFRGGSFDEVYYESIPFDVFTEAGSRAIPATFEVLRPGGRVVIQTGSAAPGARIGDDLARAGFRDVVVRGHTADEIADYLRRGGTPRAQIDDTLRHLEETGEPVGWHIEATKPR